MDAQLHGKFQKKLMSQFLGKNVTDGRTDERTDKRGFIGPSPPTSGVQYVDYMDAQLHANIQKKRMRQFLGKNVTDERTNGRTDKRGFIGPSPPTSGVQQKKYEDNTTTLLRSQMTLQMPYPRRNLDYIFVGFHVSVW